MSRQPLSPRTVASHSRLRGATVTHGVCPYCAVGCSQLSFSKDGEIVAIEGGNRPRQVTVTADADPTAEAIAAAVDEAGYTLVTA